MKGPLNYWSAFGVKQIVESETEWIKGPQKKLSPLASKAAQYLDEFWRHVWRTLVTQQSHNVRQGELISLFLCSSSRITSPSWSWWRLWRSFRPSTLWLILTWSSTTPLHWIGEIANTTISTTRVMLNQLPVKHTETHMKNLEVSFTLFPSTKKLCDFFHWFSDYCRN